MVKNELLKKISRRLAELCEKYGVTANLDVVNYFDNACNVRIPNLIANEHHDDISAICEELRSCPGIFKIYDRGANRVIRGDDFRQFEITVDDGQWTHGDEDEKAATEAIREYMDPKFAKQKEAERQKMREANWQDYLIPLPEPDGNPNTELFLTMAYEPYDWIDKGYDEDGKHLYKRTEFRDYTEYWSKKLLSHPLKTVKFQRGYGGPGRPKPSQMRFEINDIQLWDPASRIGCDPRHPKKGIVPRFFAIGLGKRLPL